MPLPWRLGCVSFLNTKPLVDGLEHDPRFDLRFNVPAHLPDLLASGQVDLALCPVFDLFARPDAFEAVPVGGIASDGETLTVKVFSRVPLMQARRVAADPDSHTSVNLLRVLWKKRYGFFPDILPLEDSKKADAVLLIGDKVITRAPEFTAFPWSLDLGAAWKEATGLPFVFAVWTKRRGQDLGGLPAALQAQRIKNAPSIPAIADRHAAACGWPADSSELARAYLCDILHFEIGPQEMQAMAQFGRELKALAILPESLP